MLTESELKSLLNYAGEHPVLSVYLNTDPTQKGVDAYKLRLRNLLKEIESEEDVHAVERYFDHEYDWSGRSVAVFSCAREGFFEAFPLAVPVGSRVRVGDRPHVKPLADLFDSYGGYGVALVDKQGARLFYFHLGELREQEGVFGENVRRTKRGGGSQYAGRRGGVAGLTKHAEEVTERNMREAAEFAANFFTENHIRRVLIGGTEDNVAQFKSLLPKAWQSLFVGSFPISMTASHGEVLEKTMRLANEAEQKRKTRLLERVLTEAAKGRHGVIRLEDTLGAVHEGRVQVLAVSEGFRAPGYRCTGCNYLTTQTLEICLFCGGQFEQIPDAVELAVYRVMQDGGEVEVVHNSPALEKMGHIGGLLRY